MIFGIYSRDNAPIRPDWIEGMRRRAQRWPADHEASHVGEGCFVAMRERSRHAGAATNASAAESDGRLAVVLDGRIDNREELRGELGLADGRNDAALVLAAFRRWGSDFPSRLIGDFAIALFSDAGGHMQLVRDQLGVRPLFLAHGDGFTAFASSMDVLLALPFVDMTPNRVWLGDFLEVIKPDHRSSPYCGIEALPPATTLRVGPDGEVESQFWSPPPLDDVLDLDLAEAVEEYRRLFDQAVACRLPASGPVASELSGGLDSTSVAVTAAPMLAARGDKLVTLSHVLPEGFENAPAKGDERALVMAVLERMPQGKHHWLTESHASQIEAMAETIDRHGGLQQRDFNSVDHGLAAAMREADCRVLLSGFGGDQLATSLGHGLKESLAQAKRWKDLAQANSGVVAALAWRSSFGRRLLKSRAFGKLEAKARSAGRITRREWLSDADLARRRQAYPQLPVWGTIGQRDRQVITAPQIAQRAQDSAIGAFADGFEYAYPMLDLRLVEFCLRLPDLLKRTVACRRPLIRKAMKGRLPDSVRLRDNKSPAANPLAVAQYEAEIDDYRSLFEATRDSRLVNNLVNLENVIERLGVGNNRLSGATGLPLRHARAIAAFCLWSRWLNRCR